ncbi:MAG: O-antigen ligase family protein [bacterium]
MLAVARSRPLKLGTDGLVAALATLVALLSALAIPRLDPSVTVFVTAMAALYVLSFGLVLVRPGHGLVVYALLLPFWEWLRLNLVNRDIVSYGWATLGTRWEELFFVLILLGRRRAHLKTALTSTPILDFLLLGYLALQLAYFAAQHFHVQALWGVKVDFAYLVPLLLLRFAYLERDDLRRMFLVSVWIGAAVALFGVYQVYFLEESDLTALGFGRQSPFGAFIPWNFKRESIGMFRAISVIGDPLSLSTYLLVLLLWAIPVAVYYPNGRVAHPLKLVVAALAAGLYFTFTRSAWIGAAAGVAIVLVAMARRRETVLFALLGLIGAAGLLVATGGIEFIKVTLALGEPSSRNHFRELWDGAKYMLAHPLGIGIGKVGRAFLRFIGIGTGFGVESWFLQIGIELGILGLALYVGLSAEAARLAWKAFRRARDPFLETFALGAMASWVGLTIYGITLPAWGYVAGPYLATLVIALAVFHVPRADALAASSTPR